MNYNFKDFFKQYNPVHNSEWVSNSHWIIKKAILKKSQLNYVNSFPEQDQKINSLKNLLEQQEQKEIISDFEPEWFIPGEEYNTVIGENNNAIQEQYYNFITDIKCKICICDEDNKKPLSIYHWQHGQYIFVGLLLPLNPNSINKQNVIPYKERLEQLEQEQKQAEQRKDNMKKCLYISDNKAVIRNKEVISIAELVNDPEYNNIYVESDYKKDGGFIFIDFGFILMNVGFMSHYNVEIDDIKNRVRQMKGFTFEDYKRHIQESYNNNQFINIAEIKLMELAGEDTEELIKYRQEWYNRKEQEEQERCRQREQEEKQFVEQKNKELAEIIRQAEEGIINKQEIINKEITIYKSKYDYNTTSLILYLMKENDIKIPLKTQGWINDALHSICYDTDSESYSYKYYKSSANSKVFYKYLSQLIEKYNAKEAITA